MHRANQADELREVHRLDETVPIPTPIPTPTPSPTTNRIPQLIERLAVPLFVFVAVLYLVCFNGRWRIGLDSANYRGLADSIASGRGYVFGEWAGKNIYPGYPLLLAGVQKIFGANVFRPVATLVVMLICSALTMFVTYRLIRLHYPKWIAATITFGVAINSWFLQQTSELMTDVPFMLGVVMALYGWDLLRAARRESRSSMRSLAILLFGLLLAASMRPTFLILVGAWGAVCAVGIVIGGKENRAFYATCLSALVLVWLVMVAIDPRSKGFHPFSGGYEREAIDLLGEQNGRFAQLIDVLNNQLPAGFFGEQLSLGSFRVNGLRISPSSMIGSIILIGSLALIARRHLLWAIFAWFMIATTVIYSDEPRYYLMILPILLLAWLTMLMKLSARLPARWGEVLLVAGLSLVTLNNLSASFAFIKEQRARDFLATYRDGKFQPVIRMAELIKKKVPAGETVIGPSGSVMSYLSGRHVITQRELLPRRGHVNEFPRIIDERKVPYAIFPATLYRDKEPAIARLMERGVLRVKKRVGEVGAMRLYRLRVVVPETDWQRLPKLSSAEVERIPTPWWEKKPKRRAPLPGREGRGEGRNVPSTRPAG